MLTCQFPVLCRIQFPKPHFWEFFFLQGLYFWPEGLTNAAVFPVKIPEFQLFHHWQNYDLSLVDKLKKELIELLSWRKPKDNFMAIGERKAFRPYLREIALSDHPQLNWRAAWIMSNMETAIVQETFPSAQELIERLATKSKDGYRREILKVLVHIELNEDEEGALYDAALKMWEDLTLAPAARLYALRAMIRISKLYPALNQEILAYYDDHYLQGVSPGIAQQMRQIFNALS